MFLIPLGFKPLITQKSPSPFPLPLDPRDFYCLGVVMCHAIWAEAASTSTLLLLCQLLMSETCSDKYFQPGDPGDFGLLLAAIQAGF